MIRNRIVCLGILAFALAALNFGCAGESKEMADNTQPAKELQAKIVYYAIPG